jgi:hypothetical protein
MLMEVETGREMEQTMPTEDKDDEDRQDETASVALQLQTPMATDIQGARTEIGIGNSDMNERAATTAAHHGQVQPSGEVTATGKESRPHQETHPEPHPQVATVAAALASPAQPESTHVMASEPQPKTHVLVTPVTNPEAFPIDRIQDVQALRYPRAKIVGVWAHQNTSGDVVQVTVDMQDGPVNHIIIDDARLISALGLREGNNDVISIQHDHLRIDENSTFAYSQTSILTTLTRLWSASWCQLDTLICTGSISVVLLTQREHRTYSKRGTSRHRLGGERRIFGRRLRATGNWNMVVVERCIETKG